MVQWALSLPGASFLSTPLSLSVPLWLSHLSTDARHDLFPPIRSSPPFAFLSWAREDLHLFWAASWQESSQRSLSPNFSWTITICRVAHHACCSSTQAGFPSLMCISFPKQPGLLFSKLSSFSPTQWVGVQPSLLWKKNDVKNDGSNCLHYCLLCLHKGGREAENKQGACNLPSCTIPSCPVTMLKVTLVWPSSAVEWVQCQGSIYKHRK